MRIAKTFGERTASFEEVQEPKKKYILVFEGEKTEYMYFRNIDECSQELGISSLLEIKPLLRSYKEKSHSHPTKIIKILKRYVESKRREFVTYDEIISYFIDFFIYQIEASDDAFYTSQTIGQIIESYFNDNYDTSQNLIPAEIDTIIELTIAYLATVFQSCPTCEAIAEYIESHVQIFDSELDKICLIIDRDPQNFSTEQFIEVVENCDENNFNIFISNPCFEFWLLLHFDEVLSFDRNEMLENRKRSPHAKKRYLEDRLTDINGSYNKTNLNFSHFKNRIAKAIVNEREFCEILIDLESTLGSNVGCLLDELLGGVQ